MPATVVIPALNEAERIGGAIDAAFAAGASEVIVADGGSSDGTLSIAQQHGAKTVTGQRMRARQLNAGAQAASHETLIFVHADTLLPAGAAAAVEEALQHARFGGFRVEFLERTPGLVWTAFAINTRTRLSRCPWGDQAQFIRRETFLASGGYPEYPLMEDYAFAVRMKRDSVLLPLKVRTSGRRFLQKGLVRTTVLNWLIVIAYRLGVSPERLARWYRR
ncbi:MAG TPA: TIGR04283 family arsenosugar biosynthesis glycosyltransferase [Thermoanaerobaculia bacterium]